MLTPWYVTGFCDGEAAFTYNRTGSRNINPCLSIKVRDDDRGLLVYLKEFFGVGSIYLVKPRQPGKRSGATKAAAFYRVIKSADLLKIIKHFDEYPLSTKKAMSYNVWRDMVLAKNKRFRRPDFIKLEELATKLSSINTKNTFLANYHA